jgi:predicted permease
MLDKLIQLWRRLLFYKRREQFDRELEEEMRFHMEMKAEENRRAGLTREQARYAARRQFGNQTLLREASRETWGVRWIETLTHDLRYALRLLRKNPGFTAVAVLSLALGVGANTAIFSLVDALMLKVLPVKDPERLALFSIAGQGPVRYTFNYPLFVRLGELNRSFTGVIAAGAPERARMVVTGQETGEQIETAQMVKVSGNYFSVLGVNAIAGRTLTDEDDKADDPQPVAVISYDFWKRRFALDSAAVGKKIMINDFPLTVIGVAPPGFFGFEVGRKPDLWCPIELLSQLNPGSPFLKQSGAWWIRVIGRLQPGAGVAQARDELDVIFKQQIAEVMAERPAMPESDLRSFQAMRIELEPGGTGWTGLRQQFKQPLMILMTITGLVLLIACANVANLLLARAASRQKEIAVRLAVGAGRLRLIRQLLTESMSLAMAGGALGLILAQWGTRVLLTYLPRQRVVSLDLNPDANVLGFTLAVSMLTGVLFGLAPALQTTRLDLVASFKNQAGVRAGRSRLALNKALIVGQVALSLFLLIGAGLFVRTIQNLKSIDTGFNRENLLQFVISTGKDYGVAQRANLYKQVLVRLEALPGAHSASLSNFPLLDGSRISNKVTVPGYMSQTEEDAVCNQLQVGPKFFETMGMTLLSGRDFSLQDEQNSRPEATNQSDVRAAKSETPNALLYAVINQAMARHFFPGEDPVGKRFAYEGGSPKDRSFEVIGVVTDAKYQTLREQMPKTFYVSYFQKPANHDMTIQLRTIKDPGNLSASIKRVVQEIDPKLQVTGLQTMNDIVDESIAQERFIAQLASFFSLFALLLVCIGLYGIMSYAVTRRTNEIGIRMALGAQSLNIVRMVMSEAMTMVLLGLALGLAAALATTRLISSMLFGLTPTDPLTILAAVMLMMAIAAVAGYLPARRASRVDPMVALRYE